MPKEEAPPPPPPPPPPEQLVEKVKFTAPVVVEDTTIETGLATQDDLAAKPSEAPTEEVEIVIEEKPQVIEQPVEREIFTVVEEQPSYPGGDEARIKFLQDNIKYPEEAKELGIQGKVFVTFVVEVDGSITDVRVLRGIGGGCDEEAIRVVKAMPRWVPGKQRGVPVRVQFNLPIKFTLQ
jgi:protein TonB